MKAKKVTKAAIDRFMAWSTSRYNEMTKPEAVQTAFDLLTGKRKDREKNNAEVRDILCVLEHGQHGAIHC